MKIETVVYLCLVKVPKIWLEQFWKTANSVSEGVANGNYTAKLISEYLQFTVSYYESARVGLQFHYHNKSSTLTQHPEIALEKQKNSLSKTHETVLKS